MYGLGEGELWRSYKWWLLAGVCTGERACSVGMRPPWRQEELSFNVYTGLTRSGDGAVHAAGQRVLQVEVATGYHRCTLLVVQVLERDEKVPEVTNVLKFLFFVVACRLSASFFTCSCACKSQFS